MQSNVSRSIYTVPVHDANSSSSSDEAWNVDEAWVQPRNLVNYKAPSRIIKLGRAASTGVYIPLAPLNIPLYYPCCFQWFLIVLEVKTRVSLAQLNYPMGATPILLKISVIRQLLWGRCCCVGSRISVSLKFSADGRLCGRECNNLQRRQLLNAEVTYQRCGSWV